MAARARPLPPLVLPQRIISGGQTGVDIGALEAALRLGVETGGWVPAGRMNEAGPIPDRFPGLTETEGADPADRTRRNVEAAGTTLILTAAGAVSSGTALTLHHARALGRPHATVRLGAGDPGVAASAIRAFLSLHGAEVLNVAGPRESEAPGIGGWAEAALVAALSGAGRG
jgi:hypothetical protein